jgi:hypothetical protein
VKSFLFVGVAGFEPAASSSQTRRDNRATLHPVVFEVQIYDILSIWQVNFLNFLVCKVRVVLRLIGRLGYAIKAL